MFFLFPASSGFDQSALPHPGFSRLFNPWFSGLPGLHLISKGNDAPPPGRRECPNADTVLYSTFGASPRQKSPSRQATSWSKYPHIPRTSSPLDGAPPRLQDPLPECDHTCAPLQTLPTGTCEKGSESDPFEDVHVSATV